MNLETSGENANPRQDRLLESIENFSNEIIMLLSHGMDPLTSVMHSQKTRAISSAVNDRIIPEIQNNMGSQSSGHRDTESGVSGKDQENNEQTNG